MMGKYSEKRAVSQLDDFVHPENFPNWVSNYKVQMQYKGTRKALVSTLFHYDTVSNLDRYKSLQNLHKPILLIWGTEDHTVTYNYSDSIRSLLKVDFLSVSDAGHLPYLEKPELVNKKVVDFLKKNNN
jgi:pimeloyl-ACP methyl ester carboxylesterase